MSAIPYSFGSLMEITKRPAIVFVEGHGSWLKDQDGKEYLDFIQGWAVNCLGHSPRVLVEAMARQSQTLINCSPAFYNARMIELADLIVKHSGMQKVFFANSGAEANEGAVKLARKWGPIHPGHLDVQGNYVGFQKNNFITGDKGVGGCADDFDVRLLG